MITGSRRNGEFGGSTYVLVGVLAKEDPFVVFSDAEDVGFVVFTNVLGIGLEMGWLQNPREIVGFATQKLEMKVRN